MRVAMEVVTEVGLTINQVALPRAVRTNNTRKISERAQDLLPSVTLSHHQSQQSELIATIINPFQITLKLNTSTRSRRPPCGSVSSTERSGGGILSTRFVGVPANPGEGRLIGAGNQQCDRKFSLLLWRSRGYGSGSYYRESKQRFLLNHTYVSPIQPIPFLWSELGFARVQFPAQTLGGVDGQFALTCFFPTSGCRSVSKHGISR